MPVFASFYSCRLREKQKWKDNLIEKQFVCYDDEFVLLVDKMILDFR